MAKIGDWAIIISDKYYDDENVGILFKISKIEEIITGSKSYLYYSGHNKGKFWIAAELVFFDKKPSKLEKVIYGVVDKTIS